MNYISEHRIALIVLISTFLLAVSSSNATELSKSPEEIQRICFYEVGIPANNPNYVISEQEMDAVLRCASRYIKK